MDPFKQRSNFQCNSCTVDAEKKKHANCARPKEMGKARKRCQNVFSQNTRMWGLPKRKYDHDDDNDGDVLVVDDDDVDGDDVLISL